MADLETCVERTIQAPQQRVWEVVADIAAAADTITSITKIEMLTGPEVGVGTRWKETRVMLRRETTEEMEVTEFEPPLRYVVEAESCGAHFSSEVRCDPIGEDVTRLSMRMRTRPLNLFAKLMKPLAKLALKSTCKMVAKDFDDIARAATGGDEAEPCPE